jgi:hypothetical protein
MSRTHLRCESMRGKTNSALEQAPEKLVPTQGNEGLSYRALVFFLGGRGLVVLTRPVP